MPVAAWLSYSLVVQQAPALSKIPGRRAQRGGAAADGSPGTTSPAAGYSSARVTLKASDDQLSDPGRSQSWTPSPFLELPQERLAQKLRANKLSLESVLCSYLEGALKVHQEVNCLTDVLGECEEQLQALKKMKKRERGLLYGVPISLKDTYDCMGHDSTCGLAQFPEKPVAKDGVIVKGFKAWVAIPFVKTNIPQTLLSSLQQAGRGRGWAQDEEAAESPDSGPRVNSLYAVTTAAGPMARDVENLVLCRRELLIEDVHPLDPTVPPALQGGVLPLLPTTIPAGISARVHSQVNVPGPGRVAGTSSGDPVFYIGYPAMASIHPTPTFSNHWSTFHHYGFACSRISYKWNHKIISWAYLDLPTGSSSYLALYSILNFPAGVVPVTTVMLQDEEELAFYRGYYRDRSDKNFQEVSFPLCLSPCWGGAVHS
ncbi:hypothetical protein J1605_012456 [Eschrichtius robustus]|uniref:Amidase domain-containing protein n=1 Tax=Eschrichtius robustus TaxID=9764 RepID=A0AB34GKN6_ESCRO|nr:hypothetical protein J1605_012456 [Eschrichtius robustus]